jgi:hypothetical protein
MEKATATHRALEMETARRRQSATTRARWRGSIGGAGVFAEDRAQTTAKRDGLCAGLQTPI